MFAGPTRLEALFGAGDLQCGQQALSFKARSSTTSKAAGVTARKRNNGGQTIAPPSKKRKLLAANMAARSLCLEASTKLAMAKRIGGVTLSPKIQKSKDKRSSESQEMELVGSVKESVAAHTIRHPDHVSDVRVANGFAGVLDGKKNRDPTETHRAAKHSALSGCLSAQSAAVELGRLVVLYVLMPSKS